MFGKWKPRPEPTTRGEAIFNIVLGGCMVVFLLPTCVGPWFGIGMICAGMWSLGELKTQRAIDKLEKSQRVQIPEIVYIPSRPSGRERLQQLFHRRSIQKSLEEHPHEIKPTPNRPAGRSWLRRLIRR